MHKTVTAGNGVSIGAIASGIVLLAAGVACFTNYRGIVDYMHRKDVSAWRSMPGRIGRYMSEGVEQESTRRRGLFMA
jgi:hypothetical protein